MTLKRFLFRTQHVSFYHRSCVFQRSHYDTLGLTPKASAKEVKSAFYKLSKLYHPDTNAHDPDASEKFRDVLEAYEVLSNQLSRSEYDQGGRRNGQTQYKASPPKGFKVPDDPQAAFFKSRLMRRMESKQKYDFEEWTKSHYRENFQRGEGPIISPRTKESKNSDRYQAPKANTSYMIFVVSVASLLGISVLSQMSDL